MISKDTVNVSVALRLHYPMMDVIEVARLIDRRFREGSLQGDQEFAPIDSPEPIQYQLRRALANLDEAN